MNLARYKCAVAFSFLFVFVGIAVQPASATLPTPTQPILVVQNTTSADPYQNFVPELLTTEGLNGFQTAQLPELTAAFLTNYDLVILPHFTLTAAQVTLFQGYVSAGGTLVGFRPDLQLASVFGVSSLGTTLAEGWLKIDTATPYGSGLDSTAMKFHGTADLYSLSGATAMATLYNNPNSPTASPAAAIYTLNLGKAILFSFDLTQSIVLMRQGNPAWAGYPNNHDGYNTLRASQMFMDQPSGQFWNDLGDSALNDVPQADIQLRLFSNAAILANAAKRPLPRFWYFPNQNRALLLMTGDHHGDSVSNSIAEISTVESYGGKFSEFLWYPFEAIDNSQVNTWLTAGHTMGIHFDATAQVDGSGVGGSAVTWNGTQTVLNTALASFAATFPAAPPPTTTRNHFLIWLSRNAAGDPDQTAQAKLFQNAGIEFDVSYAAFPRRWGYMTGSGLPMKFLDTATGTVIPVLEQATQFEDDIQLDTSDYSLNWSLSTAQTHYQKALSDSLTKYNTVVTMLFHPDHWGNFQTYAQTALQYAQSQSIPMYTTGDWLRFWKGRAATTVSMPSFTSSTLTFTATGSPAGLTLLVPNFSGGNLVSTFQVDGVLQSYTVQTFQGVMYAAVTLADGTHDVSVTYIPGAKIVGQISPSPSAGSTTVQAQSTSTTQSVSVAADGTYSIGPLPAGTYTVTPSSSSYTFLPNSRSVALGSVDVTNVNFAATAHSVGQTLFTTQTPASTNISDGSGIDYELGTALTSAVDGEITSVRFWKSASEVGTHTGKIWSATGSLLASVTFTNESASGWQQQDLTTPLTITANTTYVVSANTANSFYAATAGGLSSQVVNGDLSSIVGNNGRFGSPGSFPTSSFNGGNYFRDIVFLSFASTPLASVSLNPSTVVGGTSVTGTVTLTHPAPVGGAQVVLSNDGANAIVPNSVTVPSGAVTATFPISTTAVVAPTSATIVGSYNGFQSATLTITTLALSSVSLDPSTVVGGNSSTGTVLLNGVAPSGGTIVTLADDSAAATMPGSVTVPEGATGATFTITTATVLATTTVTVTGNFNGAQTATLTINAPTLSSVSLNPTTLVGGSSSTGTVTISGAAPSGGASVTLSSDSGAATVPSTVTVLEGATTATFTVNTVAIGTTTTATISGNYNGAQTATLTINAPTLSSVSLNPTTLVGGSSSTGTVTISSAAPSGGASVALSSDSGAATVPSTVTVLEGSTTATFTVNTVAIGTTTTATISGNYNGAQTATLTINAPTLSSVSLNPTTLVGGSSSTGTVTISSAAPSGGASVTLSSDSGAATVPSTVTVLEGATTATFTVNTVAIGTTTTATISGNYNGAQTATLTINAPTLSSVSLNPTTLVGGSSSTGTVTISGAAPSGGASVTLSSDSGAATVPSTVTVLEGATTATFTVNTVAIGTTTTATIGGNYNGAQTATLTINAPTLSSVSLNPTTLVGGSSSTGTVTISSAAPSGGASVTLSSDSGAATVPSTVTVLEGSTTATFTVNTVAIGTTTTATISGNYNGAQTATLTINAPHVTSVSLNPGSLLGGSPSTGTVTLDSPAPTGGIAVSLSSNNAAASVPVSVTVSAGAITANFPVTTSGVGAATSVSISASLNAIVSTTLTINPAVITTLTLNPGEVIGGTASIGTVTLSGPAPAGGAVVALSSDNTAASVPSTVTVAGGLSAATFSVGTGAVLTQTSVSISATYLGTATASLTIGTTALSSLSLNPTTVGGGTSSQATLTLTGPAPTGGVVVTLSGDYPVVPGLEGVYSSAGLPAGGSLDWSSFGAEFFSVNSGTSAPVAGLSGVNATLTTATGLSMVTMTNCDFGGDCGWYGNFAPGARVLWMNGTYDGYTGWWAPNGPLTIRLNSPQRGIGFQMMADETGAFTATLCAYNAADTLLGCVPFNGTGTGTADNSAPFFGLYDDVQDISKVTIDAGGLLYPHDFAIGQMFVTGARRPMVPATVTVPAGVTTLTFPVNTFTVPATISTDITATYQATRSVNLTINPSVLSTITLTPNTVPGGTSLIGTATLTGSAPAGGVVVALSANNPVSTGVQSVTDVTGLPQDGAVIWTDLGPSFTFVPSGTVAPVNGINGATLTVSTANGLPPAVLTNCPAIADCGWAGNFVPAAPVLWVGGNYDASGVNWISNGPMTLALNSPQRGLGFRIMADEAGPFTGTVCAYNAANTLLGCVPFNGIGAPYAGFATGIAAYVGVYDDVAEISKVIVDAGGPLYPHDFAIGQVSVSTSRRMVPTSVTVQAGAKTATFPVNTDTVTDVTTVAITGNYQGAHAGTLTINPPQLSSLAVSPSSVVGGSSATGTVTLGTPAPGGGSIVSLTSNNAAAVVPANVTVAAGATTASFTITTGSVAATASATISATYLGVTKTAPLSVTNPVLSSLSMNPASLAGGAPSTGTVVITGPAPVGGAIVTLSDNNASANTPASVTIPAGATSATFSVTTIAVASVTSVTITGNYNGVQSGTLTINPAQLSSVSMSPNTLTGGSSSTGTVTLTAIAPTGGTVVTLSDNSASATTPASVTVAAGATTATFTVSTVAVGTTTPVTISATLGSTTQTATLTINAPVLSNLTMNPVSVTSGISSTGTVTLSSAAPTGGAVVTLSDDSASSTTPASVTVAAGATTATFTVTTIGVNSNTVVTITGNFHGLRTATLTITAPVLSNLTLNPTTVVGGNSSTGTVTLSGVAPPGGATVTLSSNNANATVPANVVVAAGATTGTFTVATTGVSAANSVTVTAIYSVTRTATLTVNPAALTSVAMNPTPVIGGTSSTGTVTLTGMAPAGGITVTLSDNNANATTPASVIVAQGSSTATFTVTTIPVAANATVTVTALYNGVTRTTTLTINPPTPASVTMNPSTVTGGTSSTGTVTLTGPAVSTGTVVALSDNSASTTTPANVTVPAGATTATFTVTSVSVAATTSVTITATLNSVAKTATLTLDPPVVASITLNPTTVIGGIANSTATVTLNAPATGSTAQRRVTLTSSNTAAATVPANVTIATGATSMTFTVTSRVVLATTTSSISASMNGGTQSATLTVTP